MSQENPGGLTGSFNKILIKEAEIMAKMRVGAITDVGVATPIEVEKPVPQKGEVLVKVKACALCTYEQRVFRGITNPPKPFLGGHEISGIVADVGKDVLTDWRIGQKVSVRTSYSCGTCYFCKRGMNGQCIEAERNGTLLAVGLGEFLSLPEKHMFPIADDIPFIEAALCEPIADVIHSIDACQIDLADDVVIIGAGIMGILHLQLAKLRGARVIVLEPEKRRAELAKSFGADVVIDPTKLDQVELVYELTEGRGADIVINTTSIYEVAAHAIDMCGKFGKAVMYASQHPDEPVGVKLGQMHYRETRLIGVVANTTNDFRRAAKLLSMKALNVKPLIEYQIPLDEIQKAFELTTTGTYRVVVTMD